MSPIYTPGKLTLRKEFLWNETVWNPSMISTALWLDAADASTVTLNGSNVSQWNDKSGDARHLVQEVALAQPTYSTGSLNGLNTLSFDGANDTMASVFTAFPTGNSARSMFIVYKPERLFGTNSIAGQSLTNTGSSYFVLQFRSGPAGDPYFAGFSNDLSDGSGISLNPKIGGVTHNGTLATLFRNGSQIAQGAKTLATNSGIFRVGCSAGTAEFAQMLLGEVVFASEALSTLNRQRIEGYLAHKWGLTASLPNDHPYKTVGPTP